MWSLLNRVPYVPVCQRGLRVNVLACQRGLRTNVPTGHHTKSVSTSHIYVPTRRKTCQRAIRCANVSNWRANVPNGVPVFQPGMSMCQNANFSNISLTKSQGKFLYLLYKTFYITLDIIVIRIICICILHFHTSCYIKE